MSIWPYIKAFAMLCLIAVIVVLTAAAAVWTGIVPPDTTVDIVTMIWGGTTFYLLVRSFEE